MKEPKKSGYNEQIERMHDDLLDLQRWIIANGKRVVIVFEGRDAAGKGGVIKAIEGPLNPRHVRTVALSRPSEREATQ